MTLHPRIVGYVVVAGGALVAAVAFRDAPLVALGFPPLVAAAVGLARDRAVPSQHVSVEVLVDARFVRAGDVLGVCVVVTATRGPARCRVLLRVPPGLVAQSEPRWLVRLDAAEPPKLETSVLAVAPGRFVLGPATASVTGGGGVLERQFSSEEIGLSVRPREEKVHSLPRASRVRVPAGDRLARSRGDGIELAEVRPELPGEHFRRINWRATARYGATHVTVRHPEQSTDVALLADTFGGPSTTRVLEVCSAAAAAYLAHRDRVGLVCFGGVLDWIEAGSGPRQLERIRRRLAATTPTFSYVWKSIDRIPPRAMPTGALVVAVSPLVDERFVGAIGATRARGHEVVVVETPLATRPVRADDPPAVEVALRLDRMEREDLRERLFERGIPVATLRTSEPVEVALASLREIARRVRLARW